MFNRDELKGFAACVDDGNGNDTTGSTQVSDARGEGYRDRHDSCDTDLFSRWSEHRIRSDRHRIQREHELIPSNSISAEATSGRMFTNGRL